MDSNVCLLSNFTEVFAVIILNELTNTIFDCSLNSIVIQQ